MTETPPQPEDVEVDEAGNVTIGIPPATGGAIAPIPDGSGEVPGADIGRDRIDPETGGYD